MDRDERYDTQTDRTFDELRELDRQMAMGPDDTEVEEFRGHKVINEQGEKIGTVTDVIYDPMTNRPAWVVVDTGLLHADHYMPLEGTYRSVEGSVVGPFDKWTVTHAAKAHKNHVMTRELEMELCEHYGMAPSS